MFQLEIEVRQLGCFKKIQKSRIVLKKNRRGDLWSFLYLCIRKKSHGVKKR